MSFRISQPPSPILISGLTFAPKWQGPLAKKASKKLPIGWRQLSARREKILTALNLFCGQDSLPVSERRVEIVRRSDQ